MIERIIEWSLRNRVLVACATLLLIALGVRAVLSTPVDALPELTENQVLVYADWMGRSPQEVEDQVTYPLSSGLQGLAGVKTVRASSMFGFSLITVVFEDATDLYFARSRVLERLSFLTASLPEGVKPQLGPDATGLGWVYQYYLAVDPATVGEGTDLARFRSLQDWQIRPQLASVTGVAEVASIGGFVKQYQVEVSSTKMRSAGVTLGEVIAAVRDANLAVGGKVVEENGAEFVLRGVGLVTGVEDLELIALKARGGVPVYLKDVATVQIGGDFRRGALDVSGREVVGGTVVMRSGENAKAVIARVKEKVAEIASSLPPGIRMVPFYDRSDLIDRTIDTLRHALAEEIVLVTLAHILFLWHFRSILIVTLPLPVSILASFLLMKAFGITSNIMSLTGIAIAIGVLVDAAIVVTENVIRRMEEGEKRKAKGESLGSKNTGISTGNIASPPPPNAAAGSFSDSPVSFRLSAAERWEITLAACKQVGRPIFFAMAVIILAFVPVFALGGQEGKLFHPLAFTKTFAMLGSTLLAVTVVPALCSVLVRGPFHSEDRNFVMRGLLRIYEPTLGWALRHRAVVLSSAIVLLVAALVVAFGLPRAVVAELRNSGWPGLAQSVRGFGKEFMPPLNEGSLLHMPVLLPRLGLSEIQRVMAWQDATIAATPEVASVAGKLGRFDTATDPAPTEMLETTIMLKPQWLPGRWWGVRRNPEWRAGMTPELLRAELTEKMKRLPGYVPAFLQPIENRILMLYTGIRGQVGVKIFGTDLDTIQQQALRVEKMIHGILGATGVSASRVQGKPYLTVRVDRLAMARYGLSARDVLEAVEVGIGGKNVSVTIEGRERYPIQVRLDRSEREDIEELSRLLIAAKPGMGAGSGSGPGMPIGDKGAAPEEPPTPFIPLGMIAKITREIGANEIASENGRLRAYVQTNVQDRDLGGFVAEVEGSLRAMEWRGTTWSMTGEYENQRRFTRTMAVVFPLVLLVIFALLFMVYHSVLEAAHVMLAVPFALSGGVFGQWLFGYPFNGAVWVGYIALFGTAVQTGVVMVVYLEETVRKRIAERGSAFSHGDLVQAVKDGARLRLRPKVMTVATIVFSLLPIMWSHRQGAEVMKPLAVPVIGGMLSSLVHVLIVTPVIFLWLRERELRHGKLTP